MNTARELDRRQSNAAQPSAFRAARAALAADPYRPRRPYRLFDPCIWREEDGYHAVSGTSTAPALPTCSARPT